MKPVSPVRRAGAALAAGAVGFLVLVAGACTDEGSSEEFCDRLADIPDVSRILSEIDGSDADAARATLREGVRDYRALEAAAPGDVRADIARVRQGVELVLEAVEANPDDLPAARQQIQARSDELTGLLQAGQSVVTYAADECGLTLFTGTTGSEPAASDPGTSGSDPGTSDPASTDDSTSTTAPIGTDPDGTTGTSLDGDN